MPRAQGSVPVWNVPPHRRVYSIDVTPPDRFICVHGHFYQPPRENPWLEDVEVQDSARPYHDWNARVTAECYATNAASRVLDADRRIVAITNNYTQISFNIGPTLAAWIEREAPDVYARILEADRDSRALRGGHGNALAQVYNHMILPLATRRDKDTQVAWGIADFRHRFGRAPEGMWLPETAVDTETLEVLASRGIAFTVLAPHQAVRVRAPGQEGWTDVQGGRVDPRRPYLCALPSGAAITVFFYDGPIARGVAFEGLLNSGEKFAERLGGGFAPDRPGPQLVHIATDGESYGHHHRFGEMALSYALHVIADRGLGRLTNYGEYLSLFPADHHVEIAEPTSWSCPHGVERWRSNCGCRTGHPGWSQEWRGPLRDALDWLRDAMARVFEREGGKYLRDPWAAREAYIDVILARTPEAADAFFAVQGRPGLDVEGRRQALHLLEMQRHGLLMYTSCGWFFDELSGIEAVQVVKYAARALQLAEGFGESLEEEFVRRLAAARSNLRQWGDGAGVYRRLVRRSMVTLPRVVAHYGISSLFETYAEEERVFSFTVRRRNGRRESRGGHTLATGLVTVASHITGEASEAAYAVLHLGNHDFQCGVRMHETPAWYMEMKAELSDAFLEQGSSAAVRVLDERFQGSLFALPDLFVEERRKILGLLTEERLGRFEGVYHQLYGEIRPLLAFMRDSDVPVPPAFLLSAEYTLTRTLTQHLRQAVSEPLPDDAFEIAAELASFDLVSHWTDAEPLLRRTLEARAEALRSDPHGGDLDQVHRLLDLGDALGITVNLWRVQNAYHAAVLAHPEALQNSQEAERAGAFRRLGERLNFNLDRLRTPAGTPG
jgi:alpha-amylase/alpha-mannosidase (GH57 family)